MLFKQNLNLVRTIFRKLNRQKKKKSNILFSKMAGTAINIVFSFFFIKYNT